MNTNQTLPQEGFVIKWTHLFKGTEGEGTKVLTRDEADSLAAELNDQYPDIIHVVKEKDAQT